MPPLMCYERLVCVGEGITDGITVVAFSPDGLSLAAGGKDGILCIWRISDGKLLHKLTTPSPVFSLVWIPDQDGVLVCGMEDGTLTTVTTAPVSNLSSLSIVRHSWLFLVSYTGTQFPSESQLRCRAVGCEGQSPRVWCGGGASHLE